jgi:maltooligosyltrehalose trehalohydrolase
LDFYRNLIRLRKEIPALSIPDKNSLEVYGLEEKKILFMRRWKDDSHVFCVFTFSKKDAKIEISLPQGKWSKILDSSDIAWGGTGSLLPEVCMGGKESIVLSGHSFALYREERL